jgi:3'(2'), 5'-bisphosphate nucleotidase
MLVLEGEADGYIFASAGCKRWDTCAGEAILEAIGGKLTDVFGNQVTYEFEADTYLNKYGVVASLKDHELYISMIPDSVKEALRVK